MLVAIAIPVFTSQLEKSRDSVSISNMRAAYAEAVAEYLTWDGSTTYAQSAGSHVSSITKGSSEPKVLVVVEGVNIKSQQANAWSQLDTELAFTNSFTDPGKVINNGKATFAYNTSTGEWTLRTVAE